MSEHFKVIKTTGWSKGREGQEYPSRVVVLAHMKPDGEVYEFSRSWQADTERGISTFWGHYYHPRKYGDLDESFNAAVEDFERTIREHNSTYKPGNISHLPKERSVITKRSKKTKQKHNTKKREDDTIRMVGMGSISASTRSEAIRKLGYTPAKMVKVYGGYMVFDSMRDYETWSRSR